MRTLLETATSGTKLPRRLAELYGGDLELPEELLYANFVTSLDGVVALPAPARSGALLSDRNPADRFLLALLRALSDAVVVGAGTLRAEPGHLWTPAFASRRHAPAFAELGRPDPRTVVVSAAGDLDPEERSLQRGALVLTTDAGAARLAGRLPAASSVRSLGEGPLRGSTILEAIRAEGHRRVLTEGGPTLMATFTAEHLVDQLFLTLSPLLAGRRSGDGRLGLLEGIQLLPAGAGRARLLSVRTQGSHLFLRYALHRFAEA